MIGWSPSWLPPILGSKCTNSEGDLEESLSSPYQEWRWSIKICQDVSASVRRVLNASAKHRALVGRKVCSTLGYHWHHHSVMATITLIIVSSPPPRVPKAYIPLPILSPCPFRTTKSLKSETKTSYIHLYFHIRCLARTKRPPRPPPPCPHLGPLPSHSQVSTADPKLL